MKIGFIGAGNMGGAMIKSLIASNQYIASDINIFEIDDNKIKEFSKLGANVSASIDDLVDKCEIIILAIKPNIIKNTLSEIKSKFSKKVLVSIAVGIPISFYKSIIGKDKKVVRVMPNTPALVGEGMSIISSDDLVDKIELEIVLKMFECMGKVELLEEKYMNEVTALTGSSPAYVFMFIESMADAAVLRGIPRNIAYKLAAQAVLGSAKMVLETNLHPGVLKDQVCSPGGTTIQAVKSLEKNSFRYSIIEAMDECTNKAIEIGKNFI